jgi:hypothetical protein
MADAIWEGHFVRHTTDGFVGLHAGLTRLSHLMERPGDQRGVRVELPDGSIRVSHERNLERVDQDTYGAYATKIGVTLRKGRRMVPAPARV